MNQTALFSFCVLNNGTKETVIDDWEKKAPI